MKRSMFLLVLFLLLGVTASYAVPRETLHNNEGDSYFQNVGAMGNQQTGNVGYITMEGTDGNGGTLQYYIWVGSTGKLMIASYVTVSAMSSFPAGDWRLPNFNVGQVIGGQS